MFSKDITGSDAFLEMPASSQALYFHLGMEADDDGFIGNPKKVMRVMGVNEDDMKILLTKKFILAFESGIVVVKHHRINNKWDSHNCKRTIYLEEFSELRIKENRAYTLDKTQGLPVQSDSRLNPVFRIDKNRIDNTRVANAPRPRVVEVEDTSSDLDEPSRDSKSPRLAPNKRKAYDELLRWSEEERGFAFPPGTITKQYRAFSKANQNKIPRDRLIEMWEEMSGQKFWQGAGFDWMNVVDQCLKKPV